MRLDHAALALDGIPRLQLAKQGARGHPQLLCFLWKEFAWDGGQLADVAGSQRQLLLLMLLLLLVHSMLLLLHSMLLLPS